MINFNDGKSFNTNCSLTITRQTDGLYVIGNGYLIPVDSDEDDMELIKKLQKR